MTFFVPVKSNQISPPQAAHCSVNPKAEPKKGTIKISPNETLQSVINVAASPKIHVPVTAAIIRFNHNPVLHCVEYINLWEKVPFCKFKYTVLSKGYKESQFYEFTLVVANEPYTSQLYWQKSTWFLFTSVYFDTTVLNKRNLKTKQ